MYPAVQRVFISVAIVLSPLCVTAQYGRRSYSFHAPVSGSQLNSANLINNRLQQTIARPGTLDELTRLQLNSQQLNSQQLSSQRSPTYISLTPQQSVKFDSLRLRDSSPTDSTRRFRFQDSGPSDAPVPQRYQVIDDYQKQHNALDRQQLQIQLQQRRQQVQEQKSTLYDEPPMQPQRKQQSFPRRQQDRFTQPQKSSRFQQQDNSQWQSSVDPQQNPQQSVHQPQDYLQQYEQPVTQDLYQPPTKQQTFPRGQSSYEAQNNQNVAGSGYYGLGSDSVQTQTIPAGSVNQGYDEMSLSGFFSNEPRHRATGQPPVNGGSGAQSNRPVPSLVASASASSDLHLDTAAPHHTGFQTGSTDLQAGSSASLGSSPGGYISGATGLQSGSSVLASPGLVHSSAAANQQQSSSVVQHTGSQQSSAQQQIVAQNSAQASVTSVGGGGAQYVGQQGSATTGQYGPVLTSTVHASGLGLQQQEMFGQSVGGHEMVGQSQAGYGMDHYSNGGGMQQMFPKLQYAYREGMGV